MYRAGRQANDPNERQFSVAELRPDNAEQAQTAPILRQSAALCYRLQPGGPEVLLITTRRSGRWIIPKGWLIDGLSPSETARQEAWEEAGVQGLCTADPAGQFVYFKHRPKKGSGLCLVDVFPLRVTSLSAHFPEATQRRRLWCAPEQAASMVNSPELAGLLREVGRNAH